VACHLPADTGRPVTLGVPFGAEFPDAPGISWPQEVRDAMSDPELHAPASRGATLERSRQDVLDAARPLPPDEDVVIEDLSDEEDRLFLAAILDV
jgi:hypothetical protein